MSVLNTIAKWFTATGLIASVSIAASASPETTCAVENAQVYTFVGLKIALRTKIHCGDEVLANIPGYPRDQVRKVTDIRQNRDGYQFFLDGAGPFRGDDFVKLVDTYGGRLSVGDQVTLYTDLYEVPRTVLRIALDRRFQTDDLKWQYLSDIRDIRTRRNE